VKRVESKASTSSSSTASAGNKLREAALARISQTSDSTKKPNDKTSGSSSQEITNLNKEAQENEDAEKKKTDEVNLEASKQILIDTQVEEKADNKRLPDEQEVTAEGQSAVEAPIEESQKKKLSEKELNSAEELSGKKEELEEQAATSETQKIAEDIPPIEAQSVEENPIPVATPLVSVRNGKRHVYSKEELLRYVNFYFQFS
jgi:hypothetical protein